MRVKVKGWGGMPNEGESGGWGGMDNECESEGLGRYA